MIQQHVIDLHQRLRYHGLTDHVSLTLAPVEYRRAVEALANELEDENEEAMRVLIPEDEP